jgi:hypothetical protein
VAESERGVASSHNKPALSVHLFKNVLTFPFIVNTFVRAKA